MEKKTNPPPRPVPRYASRYESLRPFLHFFMRGCWHKSQFKSARSYDNGLSRARLFLPKDAFLESRKGRKMYFTLRGDPYLGCKNFLAASYYMKSMPLITIFYTVVLLQILGRGVPLSLAQIMGHEANYGVFSDLLQAKRANMLRSNKTDEKGEEETSFSFNEAQLHDALKHLQEIGIVEQTRERKGGIRYKLRKSPLAELAWSEVQELLFAIGFYKNVAAVSVIGYQIESELQNLYPKNKVSFVPAQFKNIAFDRILDDEILHTALEALRTGKALRFQYHEKERIVFPLRVITDFSGGGRQYLAARTAEHPDISFFRLEQMSEASVEDGEPPTEPPSEPKILRLTVRFPLDGGNRDTLREHILDECSHAMILAEEEDALLVAIDSPNPRRYLPWLRTFLPRVEILESTENNLREVLREDIKEALANYGCPVQ